MRSIASASLTYAYIGTTPRSYATIPNAGSATYALIDATASRLALDTGGTTAWTTFDLHGNLAAATASGSATIVSALRYDAYGASLDTYTAGSGATAVPWRYQDRLDLSPDPDEPLYDAGARRYRPSLGAFTALDTYAGSAVNPLSLNRYLYAHANPTSLIDPTGHCVRVDGDRCLPTQTPTPPPMAPTPSSKSTGSILPLLPDDVLTPVATASPTSALTVTATGHPQFGVVVWNTDVPTPAEYAAAAEAFGRQASVNDGASLLGLLHLGLDVVGMFPVLGEPADLINAGVYGLQGDMLNAGISGASAIPFIGMGATGIKWTTNAVEAMADVRAAGRAGENASELIARYGKNTEHIDSLSGTASYRVPDVLTAGGRLIGEIKNVAYQPLTRQIEDFIAYAAATPGTRFVLVVRAPSATRGGTVLSPALQALVDQGVVVLERISMP